MGKLKPGALLINTGAPANFDLNVLYDRITRHSLRAAFDVHGGIKTDERFKSLPLSSWYATKENTGYNTKASLQMTSDMAVASLISVLKTGADQYVVNK